ncbi:potassium transporter TrkA [Halovenus sp. WSH3]|uniref:Potassium transporter TrkA n=1 Tax=Halovenus carboxidivorans TaxID=2692199 RepID=A0A6B0SY43_9EURY|nr:TrkA C-terminal domain-containing protein [Halovenus carboxidivorans]MXR50668.1 potassium transporter TrkA [Halovenus carboxidivorans]
MASELVVEVGLGVYLGSLAGIFPALVAFALGFGFKYLTGVSIPGLGVVVLAGGLAGVSGGLLGLLDENVAQSTTGVTAILVVLMLSLWAHAQGDKLGATVPRQLTLSRLRGTDFSTDFLERVDSYGQIKIKPVSVEDIEGYPPLAEDTRQAIQSTTWKFPVGLSVAELERKVAEKLTEAYSLADVTVTIDSEGLAEITAAPESAGLSRRIPTGRRAVSIRTLLPTGLAIGDEVTLTLPDGSVSGPVVSAKTDGAGTESAPKPADSGVKTDGGTEEATAERPLQAPTTTGGRGSVTVALPPEEARRVVREETTKLTVQSRGKNREYETIDVIERGDNQFQLVPLATGSPFDGVTLEDARFRETFGIAVLAVRRSTDRIVAPPRSTELVAGDELLIAGSADAIASFREAVV